MKRAIVAVVVLASIATIAWLVWPRDAKAPVPALQRDRATTPSSPQGSEAASAPIDTSRVRKLAPDERRRLGEQIRAALARTRTSGGTTSTGSPPALPAEPEIKLEDVTKELLAALRDSLPLVAECYKQHGTAPQAMARMTMISDPDLGTVIDTEAITDRDGKPLAPKLDECMRDTIDSLGLPPLGKPGKLKVQYTFQDTE